jgi:two-component system, NarL family, nitrate/nitrite response regulator NarL
MAAILRVLVVGEDPLARSGLVGILADAEDLAVAGQCAPDEAAALLRTTPADVVLWDTGVETPADLEALHETADRGGPVLVVLTGGESRVPDLLGAGARGVLTRETDGARLMAALQAAALGLVVVDERLSAGALRRRAAAEPLVETLTPREIEVLQLIGQGLSNRAIAERLAISEHTAKFHVNAILGKLGAQTRAEAVALGVRSGLLLL